MKKQILIFIIAFFFAQTSNGQNYISIKGKLTEKQSGKPVGYASISIKNKPIGTVTNTEGSFVFHIPKKYKDDSLIISSIGYESYAIKIADIKSKKLNIQLEKKIYDLTEVNVKPKDALEIIKKAIAKIPENYPTQPINMDAFYREMTFENDTCVEMAEAACEFYYRPYNEEYDIKEASHQMFVRPENHYQYFFTYLDIAFSTNPKDRLNIIEARTSNLLHKKRFKVVPRGGVMNCVSWDIAKNKIMLTKRSLKKIDYKLEDITTYNNRQIYVITYKSKAGRLDKGYIYIDIKTLAFVAFKMQSVKSKIKSKTTRYWTPALYKKKRKKCKDYQELKSEFAIVNYKEINGKWYLNTIRTEIEFDYVFSKFYIHQKEQPKISYKISREFLVNHVKTDNIIEIAEKDNFPNSIYSVLCEYDLDYNPVFWKNYNMIKTTPLQDSILQQLEIYQSLEKQYKEQFVVDNSLIQPKAKIINEINPYTKLKDEYYWMQNIKDPDVLKYVETENKYTYNYMLPLKLMKRNLYHEQLKRIVKDTVSIRNKIKNKGYEYYFKKGKNQNYENVYRKKLSTNSVEELIVDIKEKVKSNPNYFINDFSINPPNTLIAYSESYGLGYENTMIIKNIKERKDIDSLYNIANIIWSKKQDAFYYLEWDKTNRVNKLYKHKIGDKRKIDLLIYEEKNPLNQVLTILLNNKKHLIIESSNDFYYNEIYLLDLSFENEELQLIAKRKDKTTHKVTIINDTLYSLTVEDNDNYTLYYSPINKPKKENWKKLITNKPGVVFGGFLVLKNHIVILERQNMLSNINIYKKSGELVKTLKFKEETYTINLKLNLEKQKNNIFRFRYTSLKTPGILYEYDIQKHEQMLIKQAKVKGYNEKQYKTKLLWAASKDGTKVPVSVVYNKKKSKLNGKSPLLLTAYGSYGASTNPQFSASRLSLLDRGVIFAIAHVRGGSELGENWHEQAMQLKKKNSFDDFIACAEHLIDEKYTSKGRIVAEGGSAGGLVMGAVANQSPDLFNTIILQSAYLDVLASLTDSTAKFSSVSQGEEGNPDIPEVYNYIKSYSPYQNIKEQGYPNMLFIIGLNDNKVEYWQSLKFVAKLRTLKTNNNKLFLKTNLYAGHSGHYGVHAFYSERSLAYAFIFSNLGIRY